jgi:hydroxymethylbilane synthase
MKKNATERPLIVATRGSALALAQTHYVIGLCQQSMPDRRFEIKIIKTTGDKMQTASLAQPEPDLPKGLFTKELEQALLQQEADLAVHSLKDLPTDLPDGLKLGAVCRRADPRDVLVYRDHRAVAASEGENTKSGYEWVPGEARLRGFKPRLRLSDLPHGATIATSSTRRQAQALCLRPDLKIVPIRGNVGTRLRKLAQQPELDATILAAAGLARLNVKIRADGRFLSAPHPFPDVRGPSLEDLAGLLGSLLEPEEMVPCVGQAAIGIEIREADEPLTDLCSRINHAATWHCIEAERAFLQGMGGGCQSPVAAYARILGHQIHLRAVSFRDGPARRTELKASIPEAKALGQKAARELLAEPQCKAVAS